MGCAELTNQANFPPFVTLRSGGESAPMKWNSTGPSLLVQENTSLLIQPEDFIWLEISMVDQVECVVVERQENGKQFGVVTVVNERDPELRKKVYAREKAIIDAYPGLFFDFYVRSRLNRDLMDLIGTAHGKNTAVFKKRY